MGRLERWVGTNVSSKSGETDSVESSYAGGESVEALQARVDGVVEQIRAYHKKYYEEGTVSRDVVIVAHGHFGRVLTARWVGFPLAYGEIIMSSLSNARILTGFQAIN